VRAVITAGVGMCRKGQAMFEIFEGEDFHLAVEALSQVS
jgi:hypothetical protein